MTRIHGVSRFLGAGGLALAGVAMLSCVAGCGTDSAIFRSERYRERGEDGQRLVLDDLVAVLSDAELTDDQKRERLRGMGLRDEDVIQALISAN